MIEFLTVLVHACGVATLAALFAYILGYAVSKLSKSSYGMNTVYGMVIGVWLGNFLVYLIKGLN